MKRLLLLLAALIPSLVLAEPIVKNGATSKCFHVFISDSSVTTGAGKTGLAYNTSSLTCYYAEENDTASHQITMQTSTLGTYTSGALKEVDATNMPGWYEFCPPDAALDGGIGKAVEFQCKGATNMAQMNLRVLLAPPVDVTAYLGTASPAADTAGYAKVTIKDGTGTGEIDTASGVVQADVRKWNNTSVPAEDTAGYPKITIKDGTGTGEIDTSAGAVVSVTTAATCSALGNNSVTAAAIAADADTEIENSVWNAATASHSTVATYGLATPASVTKWNGTAVGTPDTAGYPVCTIKDGTGAGEIDTSSGAVVAVTTASTCTTATTCGTVNALAANTITAASIATDAITAAKIAADAIGASEIAAGAIGASEIADGAIDSATFAAETGQVPIRSNTAQAGANGSITLDASASAVDDFYLGARAYITGGTGSGQNARVVTAYNGTTKVATVAPNWATNPDVTSTFALLPATRTTGVEGSVTGSTASVTAVASGGITNASFAANAIDAAAIAADAIGASEIAANAIGASEIADGAIDAGAIAADAITSAKIANDAIGATEIADGAVDAATFAAGAINATAIAADAITAAKIANDAIGATEIADGAIDAATLAADTITAAKIDSTADTEIKNQVVSALTTDTYPELAACPTATASITDMLQFGFMLNRNKMTSTATTQKLKMDDASTDLCSWAVSDDSTTFTRGEGG